MGNLFLNIQFELFSIIDVFSFTNAFMLGVLFIIVKSENKKANIFLGLALLSLSAEVFGVLSEGILNEDIFILNTSLLTLPFLLFYTKLTIRQKINPWLHLLFIPMILENAVIAFVEFLEILMPFEYAFNLGILIYTLYTLKRHRNLVRNYYSDLENKTLKWLKIIVYIFIGFNILWIIEDIIPFENEMLMAYFASQSSILTLFTIFWIAYNGFSQAEIFQKKIFIFTDSVDTKEEIIKIPTSKDIEIYNELINQIQQSKVYTNPKLNLAILAKGSNLKEKEVSRLINQQADCNFYQFINGFRVEEYKKMLKLPRAKQLSTLGIAQEAGFSSKSTFYTAFKSVEGITPKQFELSLKESE